MLISKERDDEIAEGVERSKGGFEELSWKSNLIEQIKEEIDWFANKERLRDQRKDSDKGVWEKGSFWLQYGFGPSDREERQPDL